ncbi:hypothetical protein V8D89_000265 [Ganoderma adspersum]
MSSRAWEPSGPFPSCSSLPPSNDWSVRHSLSEPVTRLLPVQTIRSMDSIPRPFSPQYVPQPLRPSPFRIRSFAPERTATPAVLPERSGSPLYLSTVSQPKEEDPNAIIHDYYNVSPVSFSLRPDGSVPRTIEMPLVGLSDTLPTHALAVLSSASQSPGTKPILPRGSSTFSSTTHSRAPSMPQPASSQDAAPQPSDTYLIPIDAESFFLAFGHDAARTLGAAALTSKWSKAPSPRVRADRATGARFVTLPVIPLYVPHPPSLPHVLLFAQGIPLPLPPPSAGPSSSQPSPLQEVSGASGAGSSASALATYLLPLAAIEEFPSAPAMAAAMARQCTSDALAARLAFNHGVWRNVLTLSPADAALVDLVRVAWNVTSEAARLQEQKKKRETSVRMSASLTRDRPMMKAVAGASRARTATRDDVAIQRDARDREGQKVPHPCIPVSSPVTTGLPPPRLPVVEVDYPVDFIVRPADVQRVIPVTECFEKRRSVQCFAPVSSLESSLRGGSSPAVRL